MVLLVVADVTVTGVSNMLPVACVLAGGYKHDLAGMFMTESSNSIMPGISTDLLVLLLDGCALCGHMQVYLDGGPFSPDTAAAYDPQHGWQHDRRQLLQRASGLCGGSDAAPGVGLMLFTDEASAAAAGDLADSLQRVWLLVEATAELQASKELLNGGYSSFSITSSGSIDRLNAALRTLFKVSSRARGRVGSAALTAAASFFVKDYASRVSLGDMTQEH